MFWTAFTWGTGASCGAAIGLMLFCLLFYGFEWLTGRLKKATGMSEVNRKSLEALLERNELTQVTNLYLEKMVRELNESNIYQRDRYGR